MSRTDGIPVLTERDLVAIRNLVRQQVREVVEGIYEDLLALIRANGGELAERVREPSAWSPAYEKLAPPPAPADPADADEVRQQLGALLHASPHNEPPPARAIAREEPLPLPRSRAPLGRARQRSAG